LALELPEAELLEPRVQPQLATRERDLCGLHGPPERAREDLRARLQTRDVVAQSPRLGPALVVELRVRRALEPTGGVPVGERVADERQAQHECESNRGVIASSMPVEAPDNVALVTGASRGIGLAIAEALLDAGMSVALNGRDESRLGNAAAALEERFPGRTLAVPFDVADLAAQQAGVARVLERFGGLDLVVANAGVGAFGPVDELDEATWRRVIDTNLTGAFFTVKATAQAL